MNIDIHLEYEFAEVSNYTFGQTCEDSESGCNVDNLKTNGIVDIGEISRSVKRNGA